MTKYSDIRDSIVTLVGGVSNIGQVHSRVRFTADWQNFNTLFKSTIAGDDQIRGWWVTWGGIPETGVDPQGFGDTVDTYRYFVRGVLGLRDADDTESTFLDLVSAVVDVIRASNDFGVSGVVEYSSRVRTSEPDIRQFGSVVCHYCEVIVDLQVVRT